MKVNRKKGAGAQITSDAESVGWNRQVLPRHDPTHDEPSFSRFDMGADNSLAEIIVPILSKNNFAEDEIVNDFDKWITVKPRDQENKGEPVLIDGETGEIKAGYKTNIMG